MQLVGRDEGVRLASVERRKRSSRWDRFNSSRLSEDRYALLLTGPLAAVLLAVALLPSVFWLFLITGETNGLMG